MSPSCHPVLYSFRRCPYAMRARMALYYSRQAVEIREVVLKHKPDALIKLSPKATVPVLLLKMPEQTSRVIDESLDIMLWAISRHDPEHWYADDLEAQQSMLALIARNDGEFKAHLDHYKYADRFPEAPAKHYRAMGEVFLQTLEQNLSQHHFLLGDRLSLADIAIFPFVRQFAHVDIQWFEQSPYQHLNTWLSQRLDSELFKQTMLKYPPWRPLSPPIFLPSN